MLTVCRYKKDENLTEILGLKHCSLEEPQQCIEVAADFLEGMKDQDRESMIMYLDGEACLDIKEGKLIFGSDLSNKIIATAESILVERIKSKSKPKAKKK